MGGASSTDKLPFGANTPAQAVAEQYKARAAGRTFLITVRSRRSALHAMRACDALWRQHSQRSASALAMVLRSRVEQALSTAP
jgi:hypothetical protein